MKISYRVTPKTGQKDTQCFLKSLPMVTDEGISFQHHPMGDVSVLCTSMAEELMNRVVSLMLTILVTVGVLFTIHCMGLVNLFKVMGCGFQPRRFGETDYLSLRRYSDADARL
jgi:hypothetical protein